MIIAIDVHYRQNEAKVVAAIFEEWASPQAQQHHIVYVDEVAEYVPGQFYKRELPCILAVLQACDMSTINAIVIDGYVLLDDEGKWGLGAYLYDALEVKIPVVGVAKSGFHNNKKNVIEVLRGQSQKPLFVTTLGTDLVAAAKGIEQMAGNYRMPDILQIVDQKTKEA